MKFTVTKEYGNEVDVKLHYESKDKIKKVLYWTTCIAVTVGSVYLIRQDSKKTDPE